MPEILDLAQKLSGAGLATLLIGILVASYRGIWVWGRELRKAEAEGAQWKAMALQSVGIAETSVNIVNTRVP